MPQMYPMLWTYLYTSFIISLMLFLTMLYFAKSSKPRMSNQIPPQKSMNWQW
uniref:ATP synthase F0 subunit 8 n=1 Tax=Synalpheus microneptunus TaxID=1503767 RepID=A0A6H0DU45_9EUCA|nr:ATP synthase F0 subunit 8 [Synalpheus microneptunus]QIS92005.1 ATP synthase F0 subunit 8 [Synalpheus microneptunus]